MVWVMVSLGVGVGGLAVGGAFAGDPCCAGEHALGEGAVAALLGVAGVVSVELDCCCGHGRDRVFLIEILVLGLVGVRRLGDAVAMNGCRSIPSSAR